MIDDLIIRPAKEEDFDDVFELEMQLEAIYDDPIEKLRASKHLYQKRFQEMLKKENFFITVAEIKGRVIAYITCYPIFAFWSSYYPAWEIGEFCVHEDFRNCKIGTTMIAYIEETAKKQGADSVLVSSNLVRKDTHRFYLNNGYKEISLRFEKDLI